MLGRREGDSFHKRTEMEITIKPFQNTFLPSSPCFGLAEVGEIFAEFPVTKIVRDNNEGYAINHNILCPCSTFPRPNPKVKKILVVPKGGTFEDVKTHVDPNHLDMETLFCTDCAPRPAVEGGTPTPIIFVRYTCLGGCGAKPTIPLDINDEEGRCMNKMAALCHECAGL